MIPGGGSFFGALFNKKINPVAGLNDVDFGAYTSQIEVGENIKGDC